MKNIVHSYLVVYSVFGRQYLFNFELFVTKPVENTAEKIIEACKDHYLKANGCQVDDNDIKLSIFAGTNGWTTNDEMPKKGYRIVFSTLMPQPQVDPSDIFEKEKIKTKK